MITVSVFLAGFSVSAIQVTDSQGSDIPPPHSRPIDPNNGSSKTLTMCIDHYPPLQVVLEDGKATGRNVELTRQFFNKLGYQLKFTADIPFKRCLQWLKEGEVDIMTGLLGTGHRLTDFHMFLYDDHTVKSFFVQKNKTKIGKFSDLKGLNIGVVRGTSQFEAFDNASVNMFQKSTVNTLTSAFSMLMLGRVDAVVCTDYYGENIISNNANFKNLISKAEYQEINGSKVYIALSRKSRFASEAQRFNNMAIEMFLSGEFKQIIRTYESKHPEEF